MSEDEQNAITISEREGDGPHRTFPVLFGSYETAARMKLLGCPRQVPWALLALHESQARDNHSQTLERLAFRGGLCPSEMVAILKDRDWESMPDLDAVEELNMFISMWERCELK
jgi:hypothetical protein